MEGKFPLYPRWDSLLSKQGREIGTGQETATCYSSERNVESEKHGEEPKESLLHRDDCSEESSKVKDTQNCPPPQT